MSARFRETPSHVCTIRADLKPTLFCFGEVYWLTPREYLFYEADDDETPDSAMKTLVQIDSISRHM